MRIRRSADDVWALIGDPSMLHDWFPGIVSSEVAGERRTITTRTGLSMPEQILTNDPLLRRFQYRITLPTFEEHTSTLDVHDLGDGTSLVVYGVDADPAPMALIIGGAAGNALHALRHRMEAAT